MNGRKKYCEECGREVDTRVVVKKESYEVCGETIEVDAQVLVCAICGEEFFCEEFDNATLLNAYTIYRKKHKLLQPEEIREIREQYGLSQRSFSKLLNWGDKTIHRYENGFVQDKAHNSLLLLLRQPENMRTYLNENEIVIDQKQRAKLLERIDMLEQRQEEVQLQNPNQDQIRVPEASERLVNLYFSAEPSIENGFKRFDYEKFCAMVLFFSHKSKGLLKTKLMKLLDYSDMIYYQRQGISISGTRYVHMPYGPVPLNYDLLFGMLSSDYVVHIEVVYESGYEKHQVIPDCDFPESALSERELEVLEQVNAKFERFGSAEISDYSHMEKGYLSTKPGEIIPYSYAKDIRLIG